MDGEQAIKAGLKNANEWSLYGLNFMWGCRPVSEACKPNCYIGRDYYVDKFAPRAGFGPFEGKAHPFKERAQVRRMDSELRDRRNLPLPVFVNGLSDTFGFFPTKTETTDRWKRWTERVERWHSFIEARPWFQFALCTKRTGSMMLYYRTHKVPANAWVGTSVENRKRAAERLPLLKSIDAGIRWVSFEPLLEDVSEGLDLRGIQWATCGGETEPGENFRPFDIEWARRLKAVCDRDGVPFFYIGGNGKFDNERLCYCPGKPHLGTCNLLDGKVEQRYPEFERFDGCP